MLQKVWGTTIRFPSISVGATENAAKAKGKTILKIVQLNQKLKI